MKGNYWNWTILLIFISLPDDHWDIMKGLIISMIESCGEEVIWLPSVIVRVLSINWRLVIMTGLTLSVVCPAKPSADGLKLMFWGEPVINKMWDCYTQSTFCNKIRVYFIITSIDISSHMLSKCELFVPFLVHYNHIIILHK